MCSCISDFYLKIFKKKIKESFLKLKTILNICQNEEIEDEVNVFNLKTHFNEFLNLIIQIIEYFKDKT